MLTAWNRIAQYSRKTIEFLCNSWTLLHNLVPCCSSFFIESFIHKDSRRLKSVIEILSDASFGFVVTEQGESIEVT
jgi:hypothetical protein